MMEPEYLQPVESPQPVQPTVPEPNPAEKNEEKPIEVAIPQNAFLIMAGTQAIPLDKALITIGRSHDNTIVLDDPRVSRKHLEIRVVRDHFVLFDLNSSGGTYVNRQRVSQGILYSGDVVSLAGVTFVFSQDSRLRTPGSDPINEQSAGDRHTAIFNSSIDLLNKKKGWW